MSRLLNIIITINNRNVLQNITFRKYFLYMECFKDFFIHNYKLKSCSEFDGSIFSKGQSIYEIIRIEKGIPLFLENHLNRLFHSLELLKLNIDESYCDLETLIEELIKKNNTPEGKIKLVVHFNLKSKSANKDLLLYFTPHYFPSEKEYSDGVKIGLCKVVRQNPNAKVLNTDARKRADNEITKKKIFEVLLLDKKGFITEGSRSNVFFIKDKLVITPPADEVLVGITRTNIIRICRSNNIEIIEDKIHFSDLKKMDSVFLSGTSLKVLPVNCIDESLYKTQNILLKEIMKLYDNALLDYLSSKLA